MYFLNEEGHSRYNTAGYHRPVDKRETLAKARILAPTTRINNQYIEADDEQDLSSFTSHKGRFSSKDVFASWSSYMGQMLFKLIDTSTVPNEQ